MGSKARKITYESDEPAFLRRLRGQFGGNNDRQERPVSRPSKIKRSEDEDDDPIYVDEDSKETISKEDYQRMLQPAGERTTAIADHSLSATQDQDQNSTSTLKNPEARKAVEASIGAKKRRIARVIGNDDGNGPDAPNDEDRPNKPTKHLKKMKIKLSFDEEA